MFMSEETKIQTICHEIRRKIEYFASVLNNKTFIVSVLFVSIFITSIWGNSAWPIVCLLIVYIFFYDLKSIIKRIKKLPGGTELVPATEEDIKEANTEENFEKMVKNSKRIKADFFIDIQDRISYNNLINNAIFNRYYKNIKIDRELTLFSSQSKAVFDGKYVDSETGRFCLIEIKSIKTFTSYMYINIRKMLSMIDNYSQSIGLETRLDFILCCNMDSKQIKLLEGQFIKELDQGKLRFIYINPKVLNDIVEEYLTLTK